MSKSTRFLILGNYSHNGVSGVSSQRTKKVYDVVQQMGGRVCDAYALLGTHDIALIVELPTTEDALKLATILQTSVGMSTSTFPAIAIQQFDLIAEELQMEIESARMEARE